MSSRSSPVILFPFALRRVAIRTQPPPVFIRLLAAEVKWNLMIHFPIDRHPTAHLTRVFVPYCYALPYLSQPSTPDPFDGYGRSYAQIRAVYLALYGFQFTQESPLFKYSHLPARASFPASSAACRIACVCPCMPAQPGGRGPLTDSEPLIAVGLRRSLHFSCSL